MTIGFAGASWLPPETPTVIIAADSRISSPTGTLTDAGIKTYDLGGRAAMVAAGHALPPITAAEVVRQLVENHNRSKPTARLGFYDLTRILGFFLKKAAEQQGSACEVAIAGFLSSGVPALARVVVSPGRNRILFFSIDEGGTLAVPVGNAEAGRLLLQGIASARLENRPPLSSGMSLIWYMSQHPGAFHTVGGGLSVGYCDSSAEQFSWPIIEVDGLRFMRGYELTACYRPNWPNPIVLPYDESWCARVDQQVHTGEGLVQPEAIEGMGFDIDQLSGPETLFQTHDDPVAFDKGQPVMARRS